MSETGAIEPFVVRVSRPKAARLAVLAIGMTGLCVFVLGRTTGFLHVLMLFGVVFSGICGLYGFARALRGGVALQIDDEGILDAASAVSAGRIAWDDVGAVTRYSFRGVEMLGIEPREPEVFFARRPRWLGMYAGMNRVLGCPPINVPGQMLDVDLYQIEKQLLARWRPVREPQAGP